MRKGVGKGGGNIDVGCDVLKRVRVRGLGGVIRPSKDIMEAFSVLLTGKPENMWCFTVNCQTQYTSILTSVSRICLSINTDRSDNSLSFSILCTPHTHLSG